MQRPRPTADVREDDPKVPAKAAQPRLAEVNAEAAFAVIGIALAALVVMFAFLGGWYTPNDRTSAPHSGSVEPNDGARPPPGEAGLIYPLVPGHGGVAPLPRAAEQPRKGAKAVFDVTADAKASDVNKGLEQVARLLNLYGAAGLRAGDVAIAAVLHGAADGAVLSDAAYAARFKVPANPNLPLIRDLNKAGVEILVCGQSLHDRGFNEKEVAPEVPVADSAMLVLINKQAAGYAYVPAR